jgi:peptidoglycan hydrolase FlgJ
MALNSMVNSNAALAVDANSLNQLNTLSKQSPQQALQGAAQQFEAMFIGMLMKSMRDATPQDGLFDSDQTRLYQSMLDQQMAQAMAKRGIGLGAMMVKQLSKAVEQNPESSALGIGPAYSADPWVPPPASATQGTSQPAAPSEAPAATGAAAESATGDTQLRDFADHMWPHAVNASRATGIPAHFMLGQAALETGWGKHQMRRADGTPSYNLFGIKAGHNWTGPTVSASTTEYVNGVAVKTSEKFRAYSSYAESFNDYAKLLQSNPRYAAVLQSSGDASGFAKSLQHAGYATDPQYAQKLARVINSSALRQSLSA